MILSIIEFAVVFAAVFGVFLAIAHKRALALEARQELIAQRMRQQRLAKTMNDDMWHANKRMRMH